MRWITALRHYHRSVTRAAATVVVAAGVAVVAPADPAYAQDDSESTFVDSNASTTASSPSTAGAPAAAQKGDVHDAQNPIAKLISIPFQFNSYHDVGLYGGTENLLLVEPVVPFKVNDDWNLITRTIVPFLWQPRLTPTVDAQYELGNIVPQFYFSPAHPGKIIWGVGPQLSIPSATGTDRYNWANHVGYGVDSVVLGFPGHWTLGLLASNLWVKTDHVPNGRTEKQLTLNPFLYYNFKQGWYLVSSEVITADWQAELKDRWMVPLGGGLGRLFKIGDQLVNMRGQFMDMVVRPHYAPSWQAQLQIQLLFPRH